MPKKYLMDTCVWRDFYEDRFSKTGNPLGKYAASLFLKIINRKDTIIFSETLIRELKKDYHEGRCQEPPAKAGGVIDQAK